MVIKKEEINEAKEQIISMVLEQVEHGQQTKVIQQQGTKYYALGQFLGNVGRTQRGIHGSSTGLRVLADTDKIEIIKGLIKYLENRLPVEQGIAGVDEKMLTTKLERDERNTIKVSEILYSLSFVKAGQANKESYVGKLKNKLHHGLRQRGNAHGWRYFLDDPSEDAQLLPTAFALLALSSNGFPHPNVVDHLRTSLSQTVIESPTQLAEVVFCLYALLKGTSDYKVNKKIYDDIMSSVWKSEYCTLNNAYEQNVEYWFRTIHEYIRVPWQLYLLEIGSKTSVLKFYSVKSQRLLAQILSAAKAKKFMYPYSGADISTRTNAILYDVLADIEVNINNNIFYKTLYLIRVIVHNLRNFFGSLVVRRCLQLAAILMLFLSVKSWMADEDFSISDLGPEFVGWLTAGLILLGKRK